MPAPLDFNILGNVPDPSQALLQGYQAGAAIRDDQLKQRQQQQALQLQQQMQSDLAAVASNPNAGARDYAALTMKYPALKDQFKQSWDMLGKEHQASRLDLMTRSYAAITSGRPDIAEDLMRRRVEAMKNSGAPEKDIQAQEFWANLIKESPQQAKHVGSLMLASVMDPEKFATTFSTLGDQGRAADKAPAELRQANATADKAVADATVAQAAVPYAETNAAADSQTKVSTAQKAGVEAKYAEPKSVAELQKMAAELGLTKAQTSQAIATTRKLGAETQKAILEMAGGMDGGKAFDAEAKLRAEYQAQTKGYTEVAEGFRRVKSASPNAQGDLSLIFGYMKMLDPGSVVREGEFATAQNAAGVPDRIRNLWNRALDGERLNDKQRGLFKAEAGKLFDAAKKRETEVRGGLDGVIKAYKLNPDNVFGGAVKEVTSGPSGAGPKPGAVEDGFRFKGGNPADPKNWERVK